MEWRSDPVDTKRRLPTRRQFVTGAAIGGGLVVGFMLWPRRYLDNLVAAPGESIFNSFLKIGSDGHVTVIVPQIELGQASTTLLPHIMADELGADWRTVAVEQAPLNPLYGSTVFADTAGWHSRFEVVAPKPQQITAEGLTLAGYAEPMRQAAAAARALLCLAAAKRWGVDAGACDTAAGFVTHGKQRLRFADLAAEAAHHTPPDPLALRQGESNRLIGRSLPRLDAPAKIDGTANYAADIRLPDLVFATIRQGPLGDTKLLKYNEAAARKIKGAVDVIALPEGLVCVGETSWVAGKMLDAAVPSFTTQGPLADSKQVTHALDAALKAEGSRVLALGDSDTALAQGHAESATYRIGLLPHLALEPLAATARYDKGVLEIWSSAQMPEIARTAAARASGLSASNIVIHAVMGGGSFGRRLESESVAQAAAVAVKLKRPVQFFWTRGEDTMHDRPAGGIAAQMTAQVLPDGRVNAWSAHIAAPATMAELKSRTLGRQSADAALRANEGGGASDLIATAQPLYAIANLGIDFHAASLGVPTGPMRGGPALSTCFFNESFINELSAKTGVEPFSFRMALLGNNPRLAQCLAKVAALAGWSGGGQGSTQGIACYMTESAAVAVIAEAKMGDDGRVRVSKLTAVADIGQLVNPDIARQQIEGGLMFGVSLAASAPLSITRGIAGPIKLGDFHAPALAASPEINVELIPSSAPAADAWDIAVPPVAPAIAGALFAGSGKRFRTLPFSMESGQ